MLVDQSQDIETLLMETAIPAVKKTTFKNKKNSPYTKPNSVDKQHTLKENPIPISSSAMIHNDKPQKETQNFAANNKSKVTTTTEQERSKNITETKEQMEVEVNLKEQEVETKPSNTSWLNQLDLPYLTEKRIEPVKRSNKEDRLKELRKGKMKENKYQDLAERVTNLERHISLIDGFEEYLLENLVDKVADTEVGTKLVYLFDLFPKFRLAFQRKLKLKPKTTSKMITKESVITNAVNIIRENKISKVYGQIEGQNGEIFLDSCASINMITRATLKKYNINKKPVGNITEMIFQAYINTTSVDIYELEISIGPITFKDYFRVIEKDDLFELLIGVDSFKKHKLILNFNDDTLYTTDKNNSQ